MATKTVPTYNSTAPTTTKFRVSMMGADGEKRSVSIPIDIAATDIELNAYIDAIQAATNATIYEAVKLLAMSSVPLEANADTDVFQSVFANIVLLYKDVPNLATFNNFLPAPDGIMVLDGDTVDTLDPLYVAWRDATNVITPPGFTVVTTRYTERRDKNDSVPA